MADSGKLTFLRSGTPEGFASKAVSSDNDANPSVIVRELIQNSLDAGRLVGREQVQVDFVFSDIAVKDIPGIDAYRSAFNAARQTHPTATETAEAQIERITEGLAQDRVPVLQVLDNGVGLDTQRMNALLGDGLTNKSGSEALSAGSYGLGHFTAFPACDLQYILYGGVTADNIRTMSAHAILAAHFEDQSGKDLLGKDGYYITGVGNGDIHNRYRFPQNENIPKAISRVLDGIRTRHGRGSAVLLLAFNNFRDNGDPVDAVMRVAARHFFPVIRSGGLVVRTVSDGETRTLDEPMASRLLEAGSTERRTTTDTINGNKAYAAWRTLNLGESLVAKTTFGDVDLYLRPADPDENTRINLFRSGMFITDMVPQNRSVNYAKYRTFNAVILINPPSTGGNTDAFQLVRQAEGEKHASVRRQRLPRSKRAQFDELFREIKNTLGSMATEDERDAYAPENFMLLEMIADAKPITPRLTQLPSLTSRQKHFTQVPETISDFPEGPERSKPNPEPNPSPRPKPSMSRGGRRVPILATARRSGRNVRMALKGTDNVANAAIRLVIDRGADASCMSPLEDKYVELIRSSANGSARVGELAIGRLEKGKRRELSIILADGVPNDTVLKVDVVSRATQEQGNDVA